LTHIYTAAHLAPMVGAPETISTVASPTPLAAQDVAQLVASAGRCAIPLSRIIHWPLTYPDALPDPTTALAQVGQAYYSCGRCHLADRRTRVVFYRGDPNSPIAIVGEAPGKNEDVDGRPLVGDAGRLANEQLRECGIDPDSLLWMNLLGCRPCDTRFDSKDRPPSDAEKVACSERTLWMLRAVRPRVVLLLGETATSLFWQTPPAPNSWHTLRSEQHPDDWIGVGVVRNPNYLLRVLPVTKMYGEYAAPRLRILRVLREQMPAIIKAGKVKTWWPGLAYVSGLTAPVVGGGT
jgi:uracil-DNA glycosylase family 4